MAYDLKGKVALVTGGSRGIGAAIARRLARDGAQVALTYSGSKDAAAAVAAAIEAAGGKARAIKADAGDPAQCAAAVKETVAAFGGLDILVHNAGVAAIGPIQEEDPAQFRRIFDVNVAGVYAGTREAARHIRDGGRIIVISSINAHWIPAPGFASYGASKAAVSALVKGWARDLGPRGVLVNAIQPGPVDTDMNPSDGPFAAQMTASTALKRYGRVEEIANLAAFLASSESSYITGAAIDIDGGASA